MAIPMLAGLMGGMGGGGPAEALKGLTGGGSSATGGTFTGGGRGGIHMDFGTPRPASLDGGMRLQASASPQTGLMVLGAGALVVTWLLLRK